MLVFLNAINIIDELRADQTIFVLETKQNYFQAQAIDAEKE